MGGIGSWWNGRLAGQGRSRRRQLDLVLLAVGAVVIGGVAAFGVHSGQHEHIVAFWARAEVDGSDDGTARITEAIDYDFGAERRHGIFRVVPDVPIRQASHIRVASPDAPDRRQVTSEDGGVNIRIGNPSRTVSGTHRYNIGYPLDVVDGRVLAWDAVGTDWPVGIDAAEVHVVAPFALDDVECFRGRAGSTDSCTDDVRHVEPGHLVVETSGLGRGEGLTIRARVGDELASGTPDLPAVPDPAGPPGPSLFEGALVAIVATMVGGVLGLVVVRRAGRERVLVGAGGPASSAFDAAGGPAQPEGLSMVRVDSDRLAEMATTDFAPPPGISAAQGGVLLDEQVLPRHQVAWLLEAAVDGTIEMTEDDVANFASMPIAPKLVRKAAGRPEDQAVFDTLFAGREQVVLYGYDPSFATAWTMVGGRLRGWRTTCGLWDARASARRMSAVAAGLLVVGAALLVVVITAMLAGKSGPEWLPAVAAGAVLGGAGLATAIASRELMVRTPQGSALWLRVESFRRFLAESEGFHADEAAKRGVLREYTAWAVAVGEIDRWRAAVGNAATVPPEQGIGYMYMASHMDHGVSEWTKPPPPPPSSSDWSSGGGGGFSGGGGGGSSVGGGSGGGGGGSW